MPTLRTRMGPLRHPIRSRNRPRDTQEKGLSWPPRNVDAQQSDGHHSQSQYSAANYPYTTNKTPTTTET